jgi:hypothetical protein
VVVQEPAFGKLLPFEVVALLLTVGVPVITPAVSPFTSPVTE